MKRGITEYDAPATACNMYQRQGTDLVAEDSSHVCRRSDHCLLQLLIDMSHLETRLIQPGRLFAEPLTSRRRWLTTFFEH